MTEFTFHLLAADQHEAIKNVVSFVGEDASGSFAIWPHHARFMTSLGFGLARFRCHDHLHDWEYIAIPGGILYFVQNELYLATRRFFRHQDYQKIQTHLESTLRVEEENLSKLRGQLQHMEQEMMRRVYRLDWHGHT